MNNQEISEKLTSQHLGGIRTDGLVNYYASTTVAKGKEKEMNDWPFPEGYVEKYMRQHGLVTLEGVYVFAGEVIHAPDMDLVKKRAAEYERAHGDEFASLSEFDDEEEEELEDPEELFYDSYESFDEDFEETVGVEEDVIPTSVNCSLLDVYTVGDENGVEADRHEDEEDEEYLDEDDDSIDEDSEGDDRNFLESDGDRPARDRNRGRFDSDHVFPWSGNEQDQFTSMCVVRANGTSSNVVFYIDEVCNGRTLSRKVRKNCSSSAVERAFDKIDCNYLQFRNGVSKYSGSLCELGYYNLIEICALDIPRGYCWRVLLDLNDRLSLGCDDLGECPPVSKVMALSERYKFRDTYYSLKLNKKVFHIEEYDRLRHGKERIFTLDDVMKAFGAAGRRDIIGVNSEGGEKGNEEEEEKTDGKFISEVELMKHSAFREHEAYWNHLIGLLRLISYVWPLWVYINPIGVFLYFLVFQLGSMREIDLAYKEPVLRNKWIYYASYIFLYLYIFSFIDYFRLIDYFMLFGGEMIVMFIFTIVKFMRGYKIVSKIYGLNGIPLINENGKVVSVIETNN